MISFEDFRTYPDQARQFGYIDYVEEHEVGEWLMDLSRRNLIVALIRKHWEGFLCGFSENGLSIDRKQKKAYFLPADQNGRTIRWDSPSRKGISRGVVKARENGFENEGIAYSVERFGDIWGIQIKPLYVFTQSDGKTPFTGLAQTKRQTRRYKFDRNPSVLQDLKFWVGFLGQKRPVIDIGDPPASSLFVDAVFTEVDVVEVNV